MDPTTSASAKDGASDSGSVAMLPADQVAAMIEQLKAEQVKMLKDQREAIVNQVMQSLQASGAVKQRAQHTGNRGSKTKQRPQMSKLEKNLHALVLHSLEESGLDFPHVQKNAYTTETLSPTHDLSRTRPTNKTADKRLVIVTRCERDGEDRNEREQSGGEASAQVARPVSAAPSNPPTPAPSSVLLSNPLRANASRAVSKRRKRHRRGDRQEEEAGDCDADFHAVRSKIGHKTLAILDRSRLLLDQVKDLPSRQRTGEEKTFVHRMRRKLANADAIGDLTHISKPAAIEAAIEDAKPSDTLVDPSPVSSDEGEEKEPVQGSKSASVTCEDIDILRPPAHSPENENEWENELARQILTIYATSVKAKASMDSPSRGDSRQLSHETTRLSSSCSLPAIGTRPLPPLNSEKATAAQSPLRAIVHYSWEPSHRLDNGKVMINMPKVPKPIWFAGTGAVKAVWCAIADGFHGLQSSPSKQKPRSGSVLGVCDHQVCDEIRRLEAKQQYLQCITTLETLLISLVRSRGVDSLEMKLWKQLVVTCNAFASRCVDYKRFSLALQLIKQAEHLIHNSILVDATMRLELLAYLYDTYAHYYYKRGKSHAGLQYMAKAHEIHTRQSSWSHLAKCQLHIANLLSAQGKHTDAIASMATILKLIEDNKLEDHAANGESSASAQKICLAAVCYNNLAIEQLHLREFEAASVSTSNAKRLAKLCLSYSNRWLAQFDATGNCVDLAIATLMEDRNADENAF